MSPKSQRIASMIEMLPDSEQEFAFEFIKRLVRAWDPNFVKLTAFEQSELEKAENGVFISSDDIDWNNL